MEQFAASLGQSVVDLWNILPWSPIMQEQFLNPPASTFLTAPGVQQLSEGNK
jgi:hypothetical protein